MPGSIRPTSRGSKGPTPIEVTEGARPIAVPGLHLTDHQPGVGDQFVDRAVYMAASDHPAMQRMNPALPAAYGLCRCPPMLEEMQRTFRLEHSMNLPERRGHVGNGAQGVAGEHAVH